MKLSPAQVSRFWKAFGVAWHVYCEGTGEAQGDAVRANLWRKEQLAACGFTSLTLVDRTHGFDTVMLLLAQIAGDERAVLYFTVGAERRMRHLIRERLELLTKVSGSRFDWNYARGIMDHMNLAADLDDVPVEQLFAVFEALDTHLRRTKKRGHEKPHAPEHHDGHHEEAA